MTVYGPLVSVHNVEDAVINTLRAWLETYLAEVERQNNLEIGTLARPPVTESIYADSDFLSYQQDEMPAVVVDVKPTGLPEHMKSVGYAQLYEVRVGTLVITDVPVASRRLASLYGAAITGTLLQRGSLGHFATKTILMGATDVTLPEPDERRFALSTTTFHVVVDPIATEEGPPGPPSVTPDVPHPDWPTVTETDIAFTAI